MNQQPDTKKKEIIAGLAVLIIIVVIVAATTMVNKKDSSGALAATASTGSSSSTNVSSAGTSTVSSSTGVTYSDGSYTAASSYSTPGGIEDITVKVTLQSGVITDSSVTNNANNSDSREYQDQFVSGYKQFVVGKAVSSLSLSRVSGSSLTSQGFNDALNQIKAQAQQNG